MRLTLSANKPYDHDSFEVEIFAMGAQDWEEMLHRKPNPNVTRFKVMTMDEQVEMIEKITQEDPWGKRRKQISRSNKGMKEGDVVTRRS
jgi:hypothetical protein